ncbi:alpha/beta fold hydrolase [Embleya sp. NPDC001921]
MRRLAALGISLVLTGAGITAGQTMASAASTDDLTFGACPADVAGSYPNIRCGTVRAPIDYANPLRGSVDLAVSKLPASNPAKRRGVLVINPGGPGSPGLAYGPGRWANRVPAEIRETYDIIGFDPRGVGHSNPVQCVRDLADFWAPPLPDPDPAANRRLNFDRSATYASLCDTQAGKLLPHITTENMARDLDLVRHRLGESKISYVGYSAGTYLAAVYGRLFPARVDRMILDGNVDPVPTDLWYRQFLAQADAAGTALDTYLDWLAAHDDVFGLGTTRTRVRAAWDSALAKLRATPHGGLGPYEFIEASFNNLYNESDWTGFGKALADFVLRDVDGGLVARAGDRRYAAVENYYAVYSAVTCQDSPGPRDEATVIRDATEREKATPFAWFVQFFSACYTWHNQPRTHLRITGDALPPLLLFNSVGDIATPYPGAVSMHHALPSSVLVTEVNSSRHGVAFQPGPNNNKEADRLAADYLLTGRVPSGDVSIPAHPLPDPRTAASASVADLDEAVGLRR